MNGCFDMKSIKCLGSQQQISFATHLRKYTTSEGLPTVTKPSLIICSAITALIYWIAAKLNALISFFLPSINCSHSSIILVSTPKEWKVLQSRRTPIHLCGLVNPANTSTIPSDCSRPHWSVVILMCGLWACQHPLWADKNESIWVWGF